MSVNVHRCSFVVMHIGAHLLVKAHCCSVLVSGEGYIFLKLLKEVGIFKLLKEARIFKSCTGAICKVFYASVHHDPCALVIFLLENIGAQLL